MKVDFHIHSNCSDGELEPRDILRSAAKVGCEMFSITDHDSIAAYGMLEDDLKGEKPRIVPGCEFSVSWERREVHVVGLNFDLGSPKLQLLRGFRRITFTVSSGNFFGKMLPMFTVQQRALRLAVCS